MKAIHGAKTKNDKIDSEKIARLLRGGMLPQAYVSPKPMRATRDLLRRRMQLVRLRGEALAHVTNTFTQYNVPAPEKKLSFHAHRVGLAERFADESVPRSVQVDLALAEHLDEQLRGVELFLIQHAKVDDPQAYQLLKTVPGIGVILGLVLLYEIHDIRRVAENGSLGTDHGAASQMFVVSPKCRAGVIGQHPSLTDLDDGDLKFHTDFRSVYATLMDRWLGIASEPVLGGAFKVVEFV